MKNSSKTKIATPILTVFALIAFAGNSIFCRLALGAETIDPASFTAVRLVSGALTLWLIVSSVTKPRRHSGSIGCWTGATLLFLYAAAFSFAYTSLSAGTGALILFASVQFAMIGAGLRSGERPLYGEWLGWALAASGLVYLVMPGIAAPPIVGSLLMAGAGVAWGVYSLHGRGVKNPIEATAGNFARTVPLILVFGASQLPSLDLSAEGFFWAALSGSVTSGLGYVVWYAALPRLSTVRAATVQLAVPIIAALGGALFLAEEITVRLLFSGGAILGGIGISLAARALPVTASNFYEERNIYEEAGYDHSRRRL